VPFINTSVSGTVMLMADYNPLDLAPSTETQFMDHPRATSSSIWECNSFNCSTADMHAIGPRKFIRPCAVAGDLKTYDCGNFYVATDNVTGSVPIGKLYVEYDVEFFTPQLVPSPATAPNSTTYYASSATQTPSTVGAPIVLKPSLVLDGLRIDSYRATNGVWTPPAGCYRFSCIVTLFDENNETLTATLAFFKNGVAYPTGNATTYQGPSTTAGILTSLTLDVVCPFNGTDICDFNVTFSPSGGSIAGIFINDSSVLITLA
jgi:hypothetical protein